MKEYHANKELNGLFVPKINKDKCSNIKSVSKERRESNVY